MQNSREEEALEPKNYREYDLPVDDKYVFVAVLGHPVRYNCEDNSDGSRYSGLNPTEVLTYLKNRSVNNLISFSDINISHQYKEDEFYVQKGMV